MDRDRILIFDSQWDIGGLHPSSVCWSTIIEGVEVRIYTEGRVSELEELVVDGVAEPHSHIFTSGEHTLVVKTQNSGESVRVFTYRFTPKKK